jgi:hypothetical protein
MRTAFELTTWVMLSMQALEPFPRNMRVNLRGGNI